MDVKAALNEALSLRRAAEFQNRIAVHLLELPIMQQRVDVRQRVGSAVVVIKLLAPGFPDQWGTTWRALPVSEVVTSLPRKATPHRVGAEPGR